MSAMLPAVPDAVPRSGRRSVARVRPLVVVGASIRREWGIARSYRLPFVMSFVQMLAGLASFFFLGRVVGPGVDHGHGAQLEDGYFAFVVLGTALLSIISVSLTSFARRLRVDQTTGTLEALLVSPSPAWLTVPASAGYSLVFATASAAVSVGLAVVVFGVRFSLHPTSGFVILALLAGAVVFFAAIGIAFTGFVMVFKRGESLTALVVSGLSLFGGVLYPLQVLPHALHTIAGWIPFTWALLALRDALISGAAPWGRVGQVWLAAVVSVPIAMGVFEGALRRARRGGTLGQY